MLFVKTCINTYVFAISIPINADIYIYVLVKMMQKNAPAKIINVYVKQTLRIVSQKNITVSAKSTLKIASPRSIVVYATKTKNHAEKSTMFKNNKLLISCAYVT